VDAIVEHHVPSEEEDRRLSQLLSVLSKEFAITDAEVVSSVEQMAKAAILRELDSGLIKPRPIEDLSIVLVKGEVVLWVFKDVGLYELKSHTSYVGGSQGVSIRIARGVYVRGSAFKGHRVQTQALERQETGSLVVTNQNVYFSGLEKAFRINLKKIVSVHGYSDGIRLLRESANPKPLVFTLNDPWFAANLILKLGARSWDSGKARAKKAS